MKRLLTFAFGLVYSMGVFADFSGQTIQVEWLLNDVVQLPPAIGIVVPGTVVFDLGGGQTCNIGVTATQVTIGTCNFAVFGDGGGTLTFNGFRFTQSAAAPDITAVTATGPFTALASTADTITVNLIGQNLQAATTVVDVTFAAPVANGSQPIPAVGPLGLGLLGLLLAGISYRASRRR